MKTFRNGIELPGAERGEEPRQEQPEEELSVEDDEPEPARPSLTLCVIGGLWPIAREQEYGRKRDESEDGDPGDEDLVGRRRASQAERSGEPGGDLRSHDRRHD